MEWVLYRNVDFGSPDTLVENILSLPAGHSLRSDGRLGAPQPYYSVEAEVDATTYRAFDRRPRKEVVAEIESLILLGRRRAARQRRAIGRALQWRNRFELDHPALRALA